MNNTRPLDHLATLAGIEPDYYDIWGTRHAASAEVKRELLRAMGFSVESETEIGRSLTALDEMPWRRAFEPVNVAMVGDRTVTVPIQIIADRAEYPVGWRIAMEDGGTISGTVIPSELPLVATRRIDGRDVERRSLSISASLLPGYYRFKADGHGLSDQSTPESTLIVAPRQAFLPGRLAEGLGTWGFAVQLYALRAPENWGIGDFGDLAGFARTSAELGAGVLGINPLHTLFPGNPTHASPYSPSSRRFLNALYINVTSAPDYADCPDLHVIDGRLHALRHAPLVDYPGVTEIKLQAFERLFQAFCAKHQTQGDARASAFQAFQRDGGIDLERFAIFSALDEHFRNEAILGRSWHDWPEAYRDPESPAVTAFAQAHRDRIHFHQYLQWEAERQLGIAAATCRQAGMPIGLYRDLAVGVDPNGADVWSDRRSFAEGISTGAPPDPFNLKGQSWGLPPFNPMELRAAAYRPFIAALRANMRHAGALRIDHVMGLMRLFWVPSSGDAVQGCYVRYPLDELIAVTALESQRAQCIIVGEDLGTVPEGLRDRLGHANILSTRLLYFEHDGSEFRPARSYPKLSQVSIRTQDLPTFSGFWRESDIALTAALHLLPSPDKETEMRRERSEVKQGILALLRREGLDGDVAATDADPVVLAAALYRFLSSSPACVVMVYLEDLLGMDVQTNLPGTTSEYPNWRHKLSCDLKLIVEEPHIRMLADILVAQRPQQGAAISRKESGASIGVQPLNAS